MEIGKCRRGSTRHCGFIGDQPLQIKSITYKLEARLSENIDVPIVYYDKKKDGINIEYDTNIFR